MFTLTKPGSGDVESKVSATSRLEPMQAEFLDVRNGMKCSAPAGYAHDYSRAQLGKGRQTFDSAILAIEHWRQFDLGWVHVGNPDAEIKSGQIIAVLAHTIGLWTVSLSQVIQVERRENFFGFLYKTTREHVEEGEERFVLTLYEDETVWYEIEAVSKPRHLFARIAKPVARKFQQRFVRASHRRMRQAVDHF